jgi:hypothetical protein
MREDGRFIPESVVDSEVVPTFKESNTERLRRTLSGKKGVALAAGIVLGAPYASGLAQGLDPVDAAIYGSLRILTIGDDNPPDAEFVRGFRQHLAQGNPELQEDFQEIVDSTEGTVRDVLLTAGVTGAVVAGVSGFIQHGERRKRRIIEGTEKLEPQGEQIVVLAGDGNNIADELIASGERFVPVYENADAASHLIHTSGTGRPTYINLDLDGVRNTGLSYLDSEGWGNLRLGADNLIQSKNGKRYLMVVGLGPKRDEELSHRLENIGVSQDNLRSSSARLKDGLPTGALKEGRDVIELYVANDLIMHPDIEEKGRMRSDRELAFGTGVDIYIDAWDVALRGIFSEIGDMEISKLRIATTNDDYRERFNVKLPEYAEKLGYQLEIDETPEVSDDDAWLVYQGGSEATFMAARRLRKMREKAKIIALVTDDLTGYSQRGGLSEVSVINISSIIARMIRDSRYLLREGFLPEEIQVAIDSGLLPIPRSS